MRNTETDMIQSMQRFDERAHVEMASEQVTHPPDQYQPGSERLERLYAAMSLAQRFTFPSSMETNL